MNRLSFQTQLTSIMEVLANAAVAEICRLVDDELAVVSVQMSRYQRDNRLLKRRMHLLELKTARNTAERRLRETSGRGQITLSPGIREPEPAGGVFEPQVDVSLWSGRPAGEDGPSPPMESSDVELVDPEVKEEEETKEPQDEKIAPSADKGELKLVLHGAAGHRCGLEDHGSQFTSTQSQIQKQSEISSGVEEDEDEDVVLVKVEHVEQMVGTSHHSDHSIQEGLVESSTEDYRRAPPPDETLQSSRTHLSDLQDHDRGFLEVSYDHTWPWTGGGGGDGDHAAPSYLPGPLIGADLGSSGRGPAVNRSPEGGSPVPNSQKCPKSFTSFSFEQQHLLSELSESSSTTQLEGNHQVLDPEPEQIQKRAYACHFCGKRFPAPANLQSHLRTHTGEKPFGCPVCGKKFSQFWNLKIHRNIHTGERPYRCTLCPDRFSDPSNLKKHQKRHHPKDGDMSSA